ncbi:mobilization protein [Sinomicrobium pectinilyticum]|uniref:Mobilization protein n=1 Tax=Sinomicrobium pectinilyticum TaxID=1084421 RepID=A0A3N0ERD1_SINP1|nr:MobB family relaxase [Sinomicrobium pectinilyticum]RNL90311.1 mobilization protein [Sinomicrobium pectinilyticum]
MYITITAQKVEGNYAQSAADFVDYLEKENEGKSIEEVEHFFDQHKDEISAEEVIKEIDGNTAKLKKKEPKFYSITLNPSARELKAVQDSPEALKHYTREAMKDYAKAFNREIDGRPVTVDDIKYYAKVERQRTFKGNDRQIMENQPYATKILQLKQEIRSVERGESIGNIKKLQREIQRLEKEAPHQLNGKRIVRGMYKPGPQSHIHIIMSRKDASNRYSLSPGSKYKASEVEMNGKMVKRGFDRDTFIKNAEKTFDGMFGYKRNYVESYKARKTFLNDPKLYFSTITKLPTNERAVAFRLLQKSGVNTALLSIPTNKIQLTIKAINALKKGIGKAIESGSIGV